MGGSEALIDALIRGLTKHGGRLMLRSHVDKIVVENGRAVGVALQSQTNGKGKILNSSNSSGQPEFIRARKGVISNASVWDTQKLLAPGVGPKEWRRQSITTPAVSAGCCGCGVLYVGRCILPLPGLTFLQFLLPFHAQLAPQPHLYMFCRCFTLPVTQRRAGTQLGACPAAAMSFPGADKLLLGVCVCPAVSFIPAHAPGD